MQRLTLIVGLLLCTALNACGSSGGGSAERRLTYTLTAGQMSTWIGLRPPSGDRSLAGSFDVIIREREADRIVFEMVSLHFWSVEDDLYDVKTLTGGTITVDRVAPIEASVALSVNGSAEEAFRGAMSGDDKAFVLDEEPPIFGAVGLLNRIYDPDDRGKVTYSMTFSATIDGSPVPTPARLIQALPTRGPR